jgi:GrpB-like predicted nucleotidyltransferase (UPF0157 family)
MNMPNKLGRDTLYPAGRPANVLRSTAASAGDRPPQFDSCAVARGPEPFLPADAPGLRPCDPRSVGLFRDEQQAIRARLGRTDVSIEHIGSSSVPGLVGRAEIDILVGVPRNDQVPECALAVRLLDYRLMSQSASSNERWAYLAKAGAVRFEVVIVRHLGPLWRRYVALRDYLRDDPSRVAAYAHHKAQWAIKHGAGTAGYNASKRKYWATIATP